jgi:hypothetical protein
MAPKNTPATQAKTGEVMTPRPAEAFRNYMLREAQDAATGPNKGMRAADVMDSQVDRIITVASDDNATDDDIWNADAGGTVQARDVPGLEVRIKDITAVLSSREDIENSKGYYASMNATIIGGPEDVLVRNGLQLGADIVLQTGAELIVSKVQAFKSRDRLPIEAVITAIPTASGNDVLKLRPMPKRVQS